MKIVVFGPDRRVGALARERVIDLNRGMARYLSERDEANPEQQAATRLPSRLPQRSENNVRIVRIENNIDPAGVFIFR